MEKHFYELHINRRLLAISISIGAIALYAIGNFGIRNKHTDNLPVQQPQPKVEKPIPTAENKSTYKLHKDIVATTFWVGEGADESNDYIHNVSSAWLDNWVSSFGGVDNPDKRCGYSPCGVNLKENPFYFALPYNDLNNNGLQKANAKKIPWYDSKSPKDTSMVKNRWIEIHNKDGKVAYAQWEDAGPFGEDDFDYVFGNQPPHEKRAGLDLSPGATDYLQLDGQEKVDWRFVDAADVPDGPWKKIITEN